MGRSRWVAVTLSLILVAVAVAACGGGKKETTASTNTSPSTTSSSETVASAWTLPNGNLSETRDVASKIERSNVSELGVAWKVPILAKGSFGTYFTSPVVVNGIVYTQDGESNVYAIELSTGKVLWRKKYNSPSVGPNGVTVAEGKVFGATNSSAFALSASTGEQLWEKKLIRNSNEGVDMAPGYYNGTVYVSTVPGNGKAFYNGEGKAILWAMDAKTGETKWKWDEVQNLWGNEKLNGGGGQWEPPAIDKEGNVYVGVANPSPFGESRFETGKPEHVKYERYGSTRPGPNLYTDSIVKLSPEGKMIWYHQLTPHDIQDHDINNNPILSEANGEPIVIGSGKAGIAFALSAKTGKLLWKTPVGEHNGHDEDNLIAMRKEYSKLPAINKPYVVAPGEFGGVESPAASNGTLAFFPINNYPTNFNGLKFPPFTSGKGEMVAIEQATGKIKWAHKFTYSAFGAATVSNDLVFTTTFEGTVWALDVETGEVAWQAKLPAGTNTPLSIEGEYLITAGSFPQGPGQKAEIVAFKLGAAGAAAKEEATQEAPAKTEEKKKVASTGGVSLATGEMVFHTICSTCHTLAAAGSHGTTGPNLDQLKPSLALVTHQVINGGGGMPAFGSTLKKSEIESVAKFVSSVAGKPLTAAQKKKAEENSTGGTP